jgi:hypothetical protein
MLKAHDLGRDLCPFASNESIFKGASPHFRGAASGVITQVGTPIVNNESTSTLKLDM